MMLLYVINYLILSVFFVLAVIESGVALLLLSDYEGLGDRLKRYIAPIWQINGTFAVFFVVNFEATYPLLINTIASAYVAPLLLAVILLILRNAFIAYSDFAKDSVEQKTYFKIYGISTLASYFLLTLVVASIASGIGINLQNNSINILQLLFNKFDIPLLISLAMISLFICAVLFDIKRHRDIYLIGAIIAVGIMVAALYVSIGHTFGIASFPYFLAILIVLLAFTIFFSIRNSKIAKPLSLIWLFGSIFSLGTYQYPYILGGQVNLSTVTVNAATGYYTALISAVGGAFLAIAMAFFIYVTYIKKGQAPKSAY